MLHRSPQTTTNRGRTIYDSIPLIEEDQFLEAHQDARELSPQDLMRARLQHEKEERLRLESVRSELTAKKAALVSENKKRKHDLEALEKQLNTFIGVSSHLSLKQTSSSN